MRTILSVATGAASRLARFFATDEKREVSSGNDNSSNSPVSAPTSYQARTKVANAFLCGRGLEIGAGLSPHRLPVNAEALYYDVRSAAGLQELFKCPVSLEVRNVERIQDDFPSGCDFLIAHNVLEHAPDPISTLAAWHSYVRTGGTIVLSLPDHRFCPDKSRVVASAEHLLLDFALQRTARSFESKEHIAPFILGWLQQMWVKDFTGTQLAEFVLSEQHRNENHDLHWHAFTRALGASTVLAACLAEGRPAKLLAEAHPDDPDSGPIGEIIFVYRIGEETTAGFPPESHAEINAGLDQLAIGFERLQRLRRFNHPRMA